MIRRLLAALSPYLAGEVLVQFDEAVIPPEISARQK
jgi:hypothetical protein